MQTITAVYPLLPFTSAAITALVGFYAYRRRAVNAAAIHLAGMMLPVTIWTACIGLQRLSQTPAVFLFWVDVSFTAIAFIPVTALFFTLALTGYDAWLTLPRRAALLSIPLLTTLFIWSNEAHGWFLQQQEVDWVNGVLDHTQWVGGFWYHVYAGYSTALLLAIIALTAVTARRAPQPFRGQAAAVLIWSGLTFLIVIPLSLLGQGGSRLLPLLPAVNALIFAWATFRFRLLDLAPIARAALVESAHDGMLALDDKGRIVDANPAWQALTGLARPDIMGRALADLPPPWAELAHAVAQPGFQQEITIEQPSARRYLHLQSAALQGHNGRASGHLLLLHDLTPLKLMETLEQRVAARTRDLTILYNVASLISRAPPLPTTLADCLAAILEATPGASGAIVLGDAAALEVVAQRDAHNLAADPAFQPLWQHIAAGENGFLTHNLAADPRITPWLTAPPPYPTLIAAPIRAQAEPTSRGALLLFGHTAPRFNVEDLGLLLAVGEQIGIALDNDYLRRQAETAVITAERHRLARDLHDSVTQLLYTQMLFADATQKQLHAGRADVAAAHLERLSATAGQALREMRLLIYQLRPLELAQANLYMAVQRRLEMVEQRAGLETHLEGEWPDNWPTAVEETLYRLIEEALNNALKHAAATAVTVTLCQSNGRLELEIRDDGRGFDPAASQPGLGLTHLQERAAQLGGHLEIISKPGMGTAVKASLPQSSIANRKS
ncbi:MAG: PAS domain-containing protein [Anaerolinea sp.]|nr:PAS domain-containing protein [Anaerolinea sp.]